MQTLVSNQQATGGVARVLICKELTFVMSWAMRHILPARDSVWYHPMLAYYRLLNRALLRKTGRPFPSRFRGESTIQEAAEVG
eukprot:g30070.t1